MDIVKTIVAILSGSFKKKEAHIDADRLSEFQPTKDLLNQFSSLSSATARQSIFYDCIRKGNKESTEAVFSSGLVDLHSEDELPLLLAAESGKVEILDFLLRMGADPTSRNSLPLKTAAEKGHKECVERLIPISAKSDIKSMPLTNALINGHYDCAKILFPVSDISEAKASLETIYHFSKSSEIADGLAMLKSIEESQRLKEKVGNGNSVIKRHGL